MMYSVSQFRRVLCGLGYDVEPIDISGSDSVLDCRTRAAICQFQTDHDLTADGELNRATQEKARQLVRNLQHSLNLTVDADLPVNEFLGPRTTSAIQAFQHQQGLPTTGVASVDVRSRLDEAVKHLLRHTLRHGSSPTIEETSAYSRRI